MTAFQVFRNTVVVLVTLAFAYILLISYRVLIGLLIAILVASALRPAINWFIRRGISQGVAILLVFGGVLLASVAMIILVMPPIVSQFVGYIENDDRLANRIIFSKNYLENFVSDISGVEVDVGISNDTIRGAVADTVSEIRTTVPELIDDIGNFLGELILMIVMGVYWSTSRDRGLTFISGLVPLSQRPRVRLIVEEIETTLGAYLRGIVLVSLIVGLLSFAVLLVLRVPNAATISLLYGLATSIPIIGGFVGVAMATFVALLSSPTNAIAVLIVTVLLQQFENYYLTPRIMSSSTDFDPVLVIVFVSIGFALNGIVGALLSIPVAGSTAILLKHTVFEPRRERVAPTIVQGGVLLRQQDEPIERAQ